MFELVKFQFNWVLGGVHTVWFCSISLNLQLSQKIISLKHKSPFINWCIGKEILDILDLMFGIIFSK